MTEFNFVPRRRFVLGLAALPLLVATAFAQEPQPRRPADSTSGTYRSDRLGFEYSLVPYRGHFGAKLTAQIEGRSPFARVRRPGGEVTYLEPGDMIVALDSQVIDGPKDVEAHVDETTVQFVNRVAAR